MRRVLPVVAVAVALSLGPARANHIESVVGPGEPARDFPADFMDSLPVDRQADLGAFPQWSDKRIGGWGSDQCPADHVARRPVIFVHGTTEDGSFWRAAESGEGTIVNVRQRLLDAGYCPRELWAISYTGARGYFTYNDINAEEVFVFIREVRDYLGVDKVDVIAHSLGVTVTRKAALDNPEVYSWMEHFVPIAGPNHGTTACHGVGTLHGSHACEELEPDSLWLQTLNGADETPAGPRYLVIYSSIADNWFQGPDAHSPALLDADCTVDMGPVAHNTLARGAAAVGLWSAYIAGGPCPLAPPQPPK